MTKFNRACTGGAARGTRPVFLFMAIVMGMLLSAGCWKSSAGRSDTSAAENRERAPELTPNLGWLNTSEPLDLEQLRGKVVLLDFWTYGCVNCLNVIPDLKYLEEKYSDEPFVVIGVHSAKFSNEADIDNIRRIMQRYEIEHPVVVDDDYGIWEKYGVRAWPTFVLIDPEGYVAGTLAGEGVRDELDQAVGRLLRAAREKGELDGSPLPVVIERKTEKTALAFPGKILATDDGRLFVADSNHHRIVLARQDGTVDAVVGTGEKGSADGGFDTATFNQPQGLALQGDSLFVADTRNHLIRRIDLQNRTVETVAGTGQQARPFDNPGPARKVAFNNPWDVAVRGNDLYVAMAGAHQIWRVDLKEKRAEVLVGSGREALIDGRGEFSGLNQPSGLSLSESILYVADAEASAVRRVFLDEKPPRIETMVGQGLFEFGDVDGPPEKARLQHVLGVAYGNGTLYLADTYNHKIKALDPESGVVSTVYGKDEPGLEQALNEPGGISFNGGNLFVADTNNHRILRINAQKKTGEPVLLLGLEPPGEEGVPAPLPPQTVRLDPISLEQKIPLTIVFDVEKPLKVNEQAPRSVAIGGDEKRLPPGGAPYETTVEPGDVDDGELRVVAEYYVCEDRPDALCLRRSATFVIPVDGDGRPVKRLELRTPTAGS